MTTKTINGTTYNIAPYANLRGANLRGANLHGADLPYADLPYANLSYAYLRGANLHGANLEGANLRGANLRGANLEGADLSYAILSYAILSGANHDETTRLDPYNILPETGSFTGWKKAYSVDNWSPLIVKLRVPKDALRSNAPGARKCRVSKAKVIAIETLDGLAVDVALSDHDSSFRYEVGATVEPVGAAFDENPWNECAPGVHLFTTRQEAADY